MSESVAEDSEYEYESDGSGCESGSGVASWLRDIPVAVPPPPRPPPPPATPSQMSALPLSRANKEAFLDWLATERYPDPGDTTKLFAATALLDRFLTDGDALCFGAMAHKLNLLVNRMSVVNEKTVVTKGNLPFVLGFCREHWASVAPPCDWPSEVAAALEATAKKEAETEQTRVEYLIAAGKDRLNDWIRRVREEQEALRQAKALRLKREAEERQRREEAVRLKEARQIKPTDPDARRRLFTARFDKKM